MELEKICAHCNSFVPDQKDFDNGFGTCMFDIDKFEPFVDEVLVSNDFTSCRAVYDEFRVDGETTGCENFDPVEFYESDEDEDEDENTTQSLSDEECDKILLKIQNQNTDQLEQFLKDTPDKKRYAINELSRLLYLGNKMAYNSLVSYLINSEPAMVIEEVHERVKIIEVLQHNANNSELVKHFISVLLKTPSNNTTKQIYQAIFKYFERLDKEIITEPLINYMNISKCSQKIKTKIKGIIEKESNEYLWFLNN